MDALHNLRPFQTPIIGKHLYFRAQYTIKHERGWHIIHHFLAPGGSLASSYAFTFVQSMMHTQIHTIKDLEYLLSKIDLKILFI